MSHPAPKGYVPPSHERWKRKDWDKHREHVRAASRAKYRAEVLLIAEHQAEYDELYELTAAEEGVVPNKRRDTQREIEQQIAKLQKKLDKLEAKEG